MHKQAERKTLKNLYFEMEKLRIPKNIENEQLLDWVENIIELDPYYAGLALTVAEGGQVSLEELYNIEALKKTLNTIQIHKDQDQEILETCRSYLKTIEKIDDLLRKFASKSRDA